MVKFLHVLFCGDAPVDQKTVSLGKGECEVFLHDSWWHTVYGPGTNGWHYDPKYGWQWGTHGCVAMPFSAAQWLYNWAPIGTTVVIEP